MRLGDVEITEQQAEALLRWLGNLAPTDNPAPGMTVGRRVLETIRDADRPLLAREIAGRIGVEVQPLTPHLTYLHRVGLLDRERSPMERGPARWAYSLRRQP